MGIKSALGSFLKKAGMFGLGIAVEADPTGIAKQLITGATGLAEDSGDDQIIAALQAHPDHLVKLREIETTNQQTLISVAADVRKAELAAETAQQSNINKTMQVEQQSDGRYKSGWRPTFGYVFTASFGWSVWTVTQVLAANADLAPEVFPQLMYLLIAGAAVLGVQIKLRTDEKHMRNGHKVKGVDEMISTVLRGDK